MKIPGFEKANTEVLYRMILCVYGREKQGKTHFALTAPGPIALFNFDEGLEGVVHKFAGEKEVMVSEHRTPRQGTPQADMFNWKEEWIRFIRNYRAALESPEVRTLVIDTATEAWELVRMAMLGKLAQVMPHHYGPVNISMRDVVREGFHHNKNVIWLHKMKPSYVNDQFDGTYERAGFKDLPYLAQVNIHLARKKGEFCLTAVDCRQNMDIAGMEFVGADCDFPTLALTVFLESTEDQWE